MRTRIVLLLLLALLLTGCIIKRSKSEINDTYAVILEAHANRSGQLQDKLDRMNRILQKQYIHLQNQRDVYYARVALRDQMLQKQKVLDDQVRGLTAAVAAREKQRTALDNQHKSLGKSLVDLSAQIKQIAARLPAVKKEYDFLSTADQAAALAQRLKALQGQTAQRTAQLTAATAEANQKRSVTQAALQSAQAALAKAQAVLAPIKAQHDAAVAQAATFQAQLETLRKQTDQIKQSLAATRAEGKQMQTRLTKTRHRVGQAKEQATRADAELAFYRAHVEFLQTMLLYLRTEQDPAYAGASGKPQPTGVHGTAPAGPTGQAANITLVSEALLIK